MARHLCKRLITILITVPLIMLAVYFLIYNLPSSMKGELTTYGGGDALDSVFETMSLHDTFAGRYIRYLSNIITRFDFGMMRNGVRLNPYLEIRFRNTLILTGMGTLISALIGIPMGLIAARRHNRPQDHIISTVTFVLYSIPPYILAIICMVIFAVRLDLFPVIATFETAGDFVMPVIVVSAGGVAAMTRAARSAALDIMGKQYIRVLRAKGLAERDIFFGHVLKNALPSVFAALNNALVQIMCGTLIVENFFCIPGLGRSIIESINNRSQQLLLGCVFYLASSILIAGLLIETATVLLSPGLRHTYRSGK